MSRKILSIGLQIASGEISKETIRSKASLLDWDIILFRPNIDTFSSYSTEYQGKPCLSDSSSFAFKEAMEHWRREIKQAVELGKLVVAFLPDVQDVFYATGEISTSGTGRNAARTRRVTPASNYNSIPIDLSQQERRGTSIALVNEFADLLSGLWAVLKPWLEYKVTIQAQSHQVCLVTPHGSVPVGALVRTSAGGALLLLPDMDFEAEQFINDTDQSDPHTEGDGWSAQGRQFSAAFVAALIDLDKALRSNRATTPEPAWCAKPMLRLPAETRFSMELLTVEQQLEVLQKSKETLQEGLKEAGRLRGLLYEKGHPLETAIIDALKILGFKAGPFAEGMSEFDVVFESAEGRFLGEAEGKDNKAINIEKLRQLSMNILEDLDRAAVDSPAKGVLFGNGYRFSPPEERPQQFSEKCISAAKASSYALVQTSDLFFACQYILESKDEDFASRCRVQIFAGAGLVVFPIAPVTEPGSC